MNFKIQLKLRQGSQLVDRDCAHYRHGDGPGTRRVRDDGAFKFALGSRGILSQVPGFSTITELLRLVGGGCHGHGVFKLPHTIIVLHWQVT